MQQTLRIKSALKHGSGTRYIYLARQRGLKRLALVMPNSIYVELFTGKYRLQKALLFRYFVNFLP